MCFSLPWLEQMLIWLVVLCATVALLRLVVSFILPQLGFESAVFAIVVQAIRILIWAIVLIAVIMFVFSLISCLLGSGSLPGALRLH